MVKHGASSDLDAKQQQFMFSLLKNIVEFMNVGVFLLKALYLYLY